MAHTCSLVLGVVKCTCIATTVFLAVDCTGVTPKGVRWVVIVDHCLIKVPAVYAGFVTSFYHAVTSWKFSIGTRNTKCMSWHGPLGVNDHKLKAFMLLTVETIIYLFASAFLLVITKNVNSGLVWLDSVGFLTSCHYFLSNLIASQIEWELYSCWQISNARVAFLGADKK